MCGRFIQCSDPQDYADYFSLELDPESMGPSRPRYNLAPSQGVLAVRLGPDGRRHLGHLRWGLVPAWSQGPDHRYTMINARAETLADRPAYRSALRERRCLIPAEGFYEWQTQPGGKQPYLIRRGGEQIFAMAGLWEHWAGTAEAAPISSCTIIVTAANAAIARVHDRMPVVLDPDRQAQWLDPANRDPAALLALLQPAPPADWTLTPVSRRVNNARTDDPGLIEPAAGP
ncbi:SOS response-associated peptidase [uncultured Thiodictyon sp.]|jgi:putative SOS response-associated peptidase YedK|uniref:SOS response-associated peptidase n=1 Tax=uncultured Thiodictyon sp. TaxID=1846217 RepID=UPI0025E10B62|nr:SOS response-associated peptidase [uncultured Thiodictyon sp.]